MVDRSQKFFQAKQSPSKPISDDPDLPVCPFHWSAPLHKLNCEIIFPPELDTPAPRTWLARVGAAIASRDLSVLMRPPPPDYPELNTPQYAGYIENHKIMEKLLAMAGVRLAATLNDIFDPPVEGGLVDMEW